MDILNDTTIDDLKKGKIKIISKKIKQKRNKKNYFQTFHYAFLKNGDKYLISKKILTEFLKYIKKDGRRNRKS